VRIEGSAVKVDEEYFTGITICLGTILEGEVTGAYLIAQVRAISVSLIGIVRIIEAIYSPRGATWVT
jgi:hypothetical protein